MSREEHFKQRIHDKLKDSQTGERLASVVQGS